MFQSLPLWFFSATNHHCLPCNFGGGGVSVNLLLFFFFFFSLSLSLLLLLLPPPFLLKARQFLNEFLSHSLFSFPPPPPLPQFSREQKKETKKTETLTLPHAREDRIFFFLTTQLLFSPIVLQKINYLFLWWGFQGLEWVPHALIHLNLFHQFFLYSCNFFTF